MAGYIIIGIGERSAIVNTTLEESLSDTEKQSCSIVTIDYDRENPEKVDFTHDRRITLPFAVELSDGQKKTLFEKLKKIIQDMMALSIAAGTSRVRILIHTYFNLDRKTGIAGGKKEKDEHRKGQLSEEDRKREQYHPFSRELFFWLTKELRTKKGHFEDLLDIHPVILFRTDLTSEEKELHKLTETFKRLQKYYEGKERILRHRTFLIQDYTNTGAPLTQLDNLCLLYLLLKFIIASEKIYTQKSEREKRLQLIFSPGDATEKRHLISVGFTAYSYTYGRLNSILREKQYILILRHLLRQETIPEESLNKLKDFLVNGLEMESEVSLRQDVHDASHARWQEATEEYLKSYSALEKLPIQIYHSHLRFLSDLKGKATFCCSLLAQKTEKFLMYYRNSIVKNAEIHFNNRCNSIDGILAHFKRYIFTKARQEIRQGYNELEKFYPDLDRLSLSAYIELLKLARHEINTQMQEPSFILSREIVSKEIETTKREFESQLEPQYDPFNGITAFVGFLFIILATAPRYYTQQNGFLDNLLNPFQLLYNALIYLLGNQYEYLAFLFHMTVLPGMIGIGYILILLLKFMIKRKKLKDYIREKLSVLHQKTNEYEKQTQLFINEYFKNKQRAYLSFKLSEEINTLSKFYEDLESQYQRRNHSFQQRFGFAEDDPRIVIRPRLFMNHEISYGAEARLHGVLLTPLAENLGEVVKKMPVNHEHVNNFLVFVHEKNFSVLVDEIFERYGKELFPVNMKTYNYLLQDQATSQNFRKDEQQTAPYIPLFITTHNLRIENEFIEPEIPDNLDTDVEEYYIYYPVTGFTFEDLYAILMR